MIEREKSAGEGTGMGRGTDKTRLATEGVTAETGYGYLRTHSIILPTFGHL